MDSKQPGNGKRTLLFTLTSNVRSLCPYAPGYATRTGRIKLSKLKLEQIKNVSVNQTVSFLAVVLLQDKRFNQINLLVDFQSSIV